VTEEIIRLEEALDRLLPEFRMEGRPGGELRSAALQWSEAAWAAAEAAGPDLLDEKEIVLGLRLAERPVFVCGPHRSGTTLVRNLLDGHPQLSVLPAEGTFLSSWRAKIEPLPRAEKIRALGCEWLRRLANPINQVPYWLLGRTTAENTPYVLFARRLLAWWAVLENYYGTGRTLLPLMALALAYAACDGPPGIDARVERWVEKTPTNEFYLDLVWAEAPATKVIHVVRDPISIYASRKQLEEKNLGTFRNARRVLEDLARSFEIAAKHPAQSEEDRYLLVRYEDLLAEPEAVMERLAAFLGIEPDPILLTPTVANRPAYPNSAFRLKEEPGSILRWTQDRRPENVTDRERDLVAAYVGDFAGTLGYPLKTLSPFRQRLLRMAFRLRRLVRERFFVARRAGGRE